MSPQLLDFISHGSPKFPISVSRPATTDGRRSLAVPMDKHRINGFRKSAHLSL
jgi:hypothetical protein